ncbi:MAG: Spy/CpxP family protein refolding chaperone [Bacteroidota bacterium]
MKQLSFLLIMIGLLVSHNSFSQKGEVARERIETARIGFITNRLNLSSEQAPKFWPVYNDYNDKKQDIRKSLRKLKSENATLTASDNDLLADMKEMLNLKQQEVDLEKDYMSKFLKVISARQLAELYKTERDFKEELLKVLQERRNNRRNQN